MKNMGFSGKTENVFAFFSKCGLTTRLQRHFITARDKANFHFLFEFFVYVHKLKNEREKRPRESLVLSVVFKIKNKSKFMLIKYFHMSTFRRYRNYATIA